VFFLVYQLSFAFDKQVFCSSEIMIKNLKDQLLFWGIVQYTEESDIEKYHTHTCTSV